MLNVEHFARKTFDVDVVAVTRDNLHDAAKWCGGDVVAAETPADQSFVRVPVLNPLNDRQTKAFPGDRILFTGKSYKVYTEKAFDRSFVKKDLGSNSPAEHIAGEVVNNVFTGPKDEITTPGTSGFPTFGGVPGNPGGTRSV